MVTPTSGRDKRSPATEIARILLRCAPPSKQNQDTRGRRSRRTCYGTRKRELPARVRSWFAFDVGRSESGSLAGMNHIFPRPVRTLSGTRRVGKRHASSPQTPVSAGVFLFAGPANLCALPVNLWRTRNPFRMRTYKDATPALFHFGPGPPGARNLFPAHPSN